MPRTSIGTLSSFTTLEGSFVPSNSQTPAEILQAGNTANTISGGSGTNIAKIVFTFASLTEYATVTGYEIKMTSANKFSNDEVSVVLAGKSVPAEADWPLSGNTSQSQFTSALQPSVGSSDILWSDINDGNLEVYLVLNGSTTAMSQLRMTLVYDTAPSVTITSPTASSSIPVGPVTLLTTYTDPQTEAQDGYQVTVVDSTGYEWWSSGYVQSSGQAITIPVNLPVGVSLTATVQVANVAVPGSLGPATSVSFTITGYAPRVPTVGTPTWDQANGRMLVPIQGGDNLLGYNASTGGGNGYTPGSGSTLSGVAAVTACAVSIYTPSGGIPLGTYPYDLANAWQLTATAAGSMAIEFNAVPFAAGLPLSTLGAVLAGTVSRQVQFLVTFRNAAGTSVGTDSFTGDDLGSGWGYVRFQLLSAPAGTATAQLTVTFESVASGEVHYLTAVGLFPVTASALYHQGPGGVSSTPYWSPGGSVYSDAGSTLNWPVTLGQVYLERSVDGGQTWTAVRAANPVAWGGPAETVTVPDYEVPPLTTPLYRAQTALTVITGETISAGPIFTTIVSGWTTSLANPGFEDYPPEGVTPWTTISGSTLDETVIAAGRGSAYSLKMPFAPGNTYGLASTYVYPTTGQNWVRWRGSVTGDNATVTIALVQYASLDGTQLTANVATVTPSDAFPAAGDVGGFSTFDTGLIAIEGPALLLSLSAASTDGINGGTVWLDDLELDLCYADAQTSTDAYQSWLKCPEIPAWNVPVDTEPISAAGSTGTTFYGVTSEAHRDAQVIIYPEGNPDPVVVSPVRSAAQFKQQPLYFRGDANRAKVEAMLNSGRTLLLQLCTGDSDGEQHYVSVLSTDTLVRIATQDAAAGQRYRQVLDLAEVAAP